MIIPTLDESRQIAERVSECLALRPQPEVIVADGGSGDGTPFLASSCGARVVNCSCRGRAQQMNEGASLAEGDVLLFLHADVRFSQSAYTSLHKALADPSIIGGGFRRRFDSRSRALAVSCWLADLRGRWSRIYLGDQAIFVRTDIFRSLGGYPGIRLFEDLAFSRTLARSGKTVLVREPVLASSRRFERDGAVLRLCRNLWLAGLYLLGVEPDRLARRYYPGYYPNRPTASRVPVARGISHALPGRDSQG